MKKTIYFCDRCGEEIQGVVYVLECYAYATNAGDASKHIAELNEQNNRQNDAKIGGTDRHLCRKCKDEITDGVFIV
jgi:hypothetical protein